MESLSFDNELLKLNVLDYIYNNQLITDEEYELISKLKKAFQKTKGFKVTAWIDGIRIEGGKSIDGMEQYYINNYDYVKLKRIINFNIEDVENILLTEHSIQLFYDKCKEKDETLNSFYSFLYNICEIIDNIYSCFFGNNYDHKIKLLNKKIKENGLMNVCKKLKIDKKTVWKILKGNKNCNFDKINKLFNYFNIQ